MYQQDLSEFTTTERIENVMSVEYIFFDCMETLIDLHKLPTPKDYALWAYQGSGVEELWEEFEEFFKYYYLSKKELASKLPEHAEYDIRGRFLYLIQSSLPNLPFNMIETTADKLCTNYWSNYKAGCYVKDDVMFVLSRLSSTYKMGVVSNFMVMGGIEELLKLLGIDHYFSFVITSVKEGWRKPHPNIYSMALEVSGTRPENVIFVGDDYLNDYVAPVNLGMKAVYLDRYERQTNLENRIVDFGGLLEMLLPVRKE